MARRIYIGTGTARKVKTAYIGSGNVARKIVKGYVGVGNQAKQFWPIQYVWNRYRISTVIRYTENQTGILYTVPNYTAIYGSHSAGDSYTFNSSNGTFLINNVQEWDMSYGPRLVVYAGTVDYSSRAVNSFDASSGRLYTVIYPIEINLDNRGHVSLYQINTSQQSSQVQGSYIDQVRSENRSAYPDNGVSGSYWYVYQGEG